MTSQIKPPIDFPCMILAAGRGERMRPLTDKVPKPLLEIHHKSLLEYHLTRLGELGFKNIVINHAWLGQLIEEKFGSGDQFGLKIKYSAEATALETAGGICNALHHLNPVDYFFVINGDVYAPDFPFENLAQKVHQLRQRVLEGQSLIQAYLYLVPNPPQHPNGDFYLNGNEVSSEIPPQEQPSVAKYTFSGAGLYHRSMFSKLIPGGAAPLAPLLKSAMSTHSVWGELLNCPWHDVGTPERLAELNKVS